MSATNIWLTGHEVELPEMLAGRERRAAEQAAFRADHPGTLVCFTLNIAGPVKVFPLAEEVFVQTTDRIQSTLWRHLIRILEKRVETWFWGWEAYFAVDGEAETTKRVLLELEEGEVAGRLFDIDVLRPDGSKVSRQDLGLPPRPCLVCGRESAACARSRAHTVEELQEKTAQLLLASLRRERISSEMIGRLCRQAMLLEVYTTPKPGLVDRNIFGDHRDMDLALFEKSTAVLEPFFVRYA
ncbi:MAG: citrate lyase holo-[acyl-carrier protein] synthase, partial [Lachnospiraceae bacterium]|nr:citrate lyase holo-[acyl-carrier protein] synthase [Lachnospiraceae bacterium]